MNRYLTNKGINYLILNRAVCINLPRRKQRNCVFRVRFCSLFKLHILLRGAFSVVVVTLEVGLGLMLGIKVSRTRSPLGVVR